MNWLKKHSWKILTFLLAAGGTYAALFGEIKFGPAEYELHATVKYNSYENPPWFNPYLDSLQKPLLKSGTHWTFYIKNEGRNEITDIELEVPFEGYCIVKQSAAVDTGYYFTIGQKVKPRVRLRQGEGLDVDIWTSKGFVKDDLDRLNLTIAKGGYPIEDITNKGQEFSLSNATSWFVLLMAILVVASFLRWFFVDRRVIKIMIERKHGEIELERYKKLYSEMQVALANAHQMIERLKQPK